MKKAKKTVINDKICTRNTALPWQHGHSELDEIKKGERLECGCVEGYQVEVNVVKYENRGTKAIKLVMERKTQYNAK